MKIDPLALVQAIERYLMVRGYGRIREAESMVSDDDNSEDDIDDTLVTFKRRIVFLKIVIQCGATFRIHVRLNLQAAVVISQGSAKHKLQFLIGDEILPFNMTVYQAVRQFGCSGMDHSEAEADGEPPLGHDAVWVQTHTIYYRYLYFFCSSGSPKSEHLLENDHTSIYI